MSHLQRCGQARHCVLWGGAAAQFPQVFERLPAGRPPDRHGNLPGGERLRGHKTFNDNNFILQNKRVKIEHCQPENIKSSSHVCGCCSLCVLQVEPFAGLAGAVRASVPRLLINRELVGPFAWRRRPADVVHLGDVVSGVQELVEAVGWSREMEVLMAPVSIRF